jgi:hypothetical protein
MPTVMLTWNCTFLSAFQPILPFSQPSSFRTLQWYELVDSLPYFVQLDRIRLLSVFVTAASRWPCGKIYKNGLREWSCCSSDPVNILSSVNKDFELSTIIYNYLQLSTIIYNYLLSHQYLQNIDKMRLPLVVVMASVAGKLPSAPTPNSKTQAN